MQRISTVGQHRLDQVRCIHHAAGRRTGADYGVNLVDEQDRRPDPCPARRSRLSGVFRNHPGTWCRPGASPCRGHRSCSLSAPRDLVLDNHLGQTLGQRGLADAGFAHVQRIVLAPPAQHLNGAFNLRPPADQRVYAALFGAAVQVDGKTVERAGPAFRLDFAVCLSRRVSPAAVLHLAEAVGNEIHHIQARYVLQAQQVHRVGLLLAEDGHQDIFATNFFLAA